MKRIRLHGFASRGESSLQFRGIWLYGNEPLIDLIIILSGGMTDKFRRPSKGYAKHKVVAWIISIVLVVIGGIGGMVNASTAGFDGASSPSAIELPATGGGTESKAAPAEAKEQPAAKEEKAETSWQEVIVLDGKTDKSSKVFELTGAEARMTYSFTGGEDMAIGAIYLLTEGTDLMKDGELPEVMLDGPVEEETALHKSAGTYFLDVTAANFDGWSITIEEKR